MSECRASSSDAPLIIFIMLKLHEAITWSWWWVILTPILVSFAVNIVVAMIKVYKETRT